MLEKNYDHLLGLVHKTCLRLANAAFISSEQAMQELSIVRLAIYLQILPVALTMEQLNQIFILCQPFHLQKKEGRELTSEERDRMRAKILQSYFKIS
jgi:protein-arginine kinase